MPQQRLFVNSFWDDGGVGYGAIVARVRHSTQTLQELLDYYLERINIEKEYGRRLEKLNGMGLGSHETGVLKQLLDKLTHENGEMVKYSQKFAKLVHQINYDKLARFYSDYNKSTKKILGHMGKLVAKKADVAKDLQVTKEAYKQTCLQIKSLGLSIQTTWGKELEKNERKLAKLNHNVAQAEKNYRISIDNLNKITDLYNRDWHMALSEIYQLEIERIQLVKINCFNFCNNVATLCVDNDQAADLARSFFAKISPPQDLQNFTNNYGSGNHILLQFRFIDFMQGFNDANEADHETASFENPEFDHLLSRSYSTYSHAQSAAGAAPSTASVAPSSAAPSSPAARTAPFSPGVAPFSPGTAQFSPGVAPGAVPGGSTAQSSQTTIQGAGSPRSPAKSPAKALPVEPLKVIDLPKPEDTKSNYSNMSPDEKTDIFSIKSHKFAESNSSSNYSNPTNYSSSSERNWASPRKKEKQLSQVQERINLKSKELPPVAASTAQTPSKTPIIKDFSVDFIAKALEDLNAGGNGDVNQYRRSIRLQKSDENETPTRYDSINFKTPRTSATLDGSPIKQTRPKSMYDSTTFDAAKSISPRRKSLSPRRKSLSQAKSFTNLNSVINKITPVSRKPYVVKARARYSYKPQHQGELMFKKGWNIYVIHKQPDNWYLCELGDNCEPVGAVGLVPGNYITEGDDMF